MSKCSHALAKAAAKTLVSPVDTSVASATIAPLKGTMAVPLVLGTPLPAASMTGGTTAGVTLVSGKGGAGSSMAVGKGSIVALATGVLPLTAAHSSISALVFGQSVSGIAIPAILGGLGSVAIMPALPFILIGGVAGALAGSVVGKAASGKTNLFTVAKNKKVGGGATSLSPPVPPPAAMPSAEGAVAAAMLVQGLVDSAEPILPPLGRETALSQELADASQEQPDCPLAVETVPNVEVIPLVQLKAVVADETVTLPSMEGATALAVQEDTSVAVEWEQVQEEIKYSFKPSPFEFDRRFSLRIPIQKGDVRVFWFGVDGKMSSGSAIDMSMHGIKFLAPDFDGYAIDSIVFTRSDKILKVQRCEVSHRDGDLVVARLGDFQDGVDGWMSWIENLTDHFPASDNGEGSDERRAQWQKKLGDSLTMLREQSEETAPQIDEQLMGGKRQYHSRQQLEVEQQSLHDLETSLKNELSDVICQYRGKPKVSLEEAMEEKEGEALPRTTIIVEQDLEGVIDHYLEERLPHTLDDVSRMYYRKLHELDALVLSDLEQHKTLLKEAVEGEINRYRIQELEKVNNAILSKKEAIVAGLEGWATDQKQRLQIQFDHSYQKMREKLVSQIAAKVTADLQQLHHLVGQDENKVSDADLESMSKEIVARIMALI